jgi:hypothetical protein
MYNNYTQGAGKTSGWGYDLATSSWDDTVSHGQPTRRKHAHLKTRQAAPNYQTFPSSTDLHYAMPGAYLTPVRFSFLRDQSYAYRCGGVKTSQGFYSPANPPEELQVSDEVFAEIAADIISFGQVLRMQRQEVANLVSHKRRNPADPDPSAANQGDTRSSKKRRTTEGEETGVGQATQRGDTQGLPVKGTPIQVKIKSKLGRGLDMETLVVPQGVSSPHALGPTITGATPGSREYASQAWTEGTRGESEPQEKVGMEDAHDEGETDKERWARLMLYTDGVWRCAGCGGQAFSDRCTLQRHCKSAVHGKQRDKRKCPFCPREYQRLGHLKRHMDNKHKGAMKAKEGEGLL